MERQYASNSDLIKYLILVFLLASGPGYSPLYNQSGRFDNKNYL